MKNRIKIIILIILFLSFALNGYEGNGGQGDCDTTDIYDITLTKITFYGDSRMDLVDGGGIYGNNTMHDILNVPYNDTSEYSDSERFSEKIFRILE